jgi:hypothetical protein
LPELAKLYPNVSKLPVSLRIVLESVLRNCDGKKVTDEHVRQLANWQPNAERVDEIPFVVARVVLQDFTGVPCVVDLAAMRSAMHAFFAGYRPRFLRGGGARRMEKIAGMVQGRSIPRVAVAPLPCLAGLREHKNPVPPGLFCR